jgi:hypothetical protein
MPEPTPAPLHTTDDPNAMPPTVALSTAASKGSPQ